MNHCRTCTHWESDTNMWGGCDEIDFADTSLAYLDNKECNEGRPHGEGCDVIVTLQVSRNFGCVHWEEKP